MGTRGSVRRSAGLLLYRRVGGRATVAGPADVEVLLGHMGGPYWSRKDVGAWTVPKGEHGQDEDARAAAVREFTEELGLAPPDGPDLALGEIRQRSGKRVTVWAREGDLDPSVAVSNLVEIEWPPRSGRRVQVPELDRVGWFPLPVARDLVVRGQEVLLDRLADALTT